MKNVFCTLYDSNYLDKGLVMIESLRDFSDSEIYVLCMDDICYKVMLKESISGVILIALSDFMNDELASLKAARKWGEFCWTCGANLIKYVLDNYAVDCCTYLDSDLMFYSNPDYLLEEMMSKDCCVQVVPHRFPNTHFWKKWEKSSGKNCVQFNSFTKDERSVELLNHWIGQIAQDCSVENGGDQLYTSEWGKYEFVNVCQDEGAGVAPWNAQKYRLFGPPQLRVLSKKEGKENRLVFFHFHGLEYLNRNQVNIMLQNRLECIDKRFINSLYVPYIEMLEEKKQYLKHRYNIEPMYSHSKTLLADLIPHMHPLKKILYKFWMFGWGHKNMIEIVDGKCYSNV